MTNLIAVSVAMMMASVQPASSEAPATGAPEGGPTTRYCLEVDPVIGTRVPTIMCFTRAGWEDLGVDVDKEWAANGVKVIA